MKSKALMLAMGITLKALTLACGNEPNGVYVWEREYLGLKLESILDFRPDGTVFVLEKVTDTGHVPDGLTQTEKNFRSLVMESPKRDYGKQPWKREGDQVFVNLTYPERSAREDYEVEARRDLAAGKEPRPFKYEPTTANVVFRFEGDDLVRVRVNAMQLEKPAFFKKR
jgi:hypothetical protein